MDTGRTDILSRHPVPRHRLTVADYHRLGEAGILGEDDRVELLEGQLVDMSPIGPRHALAVDALTELLVVAVAGRAGVRVRNPIESGRRDGTATGHRPGQATVARLPDLAPAARRHLPGDRGGGHKPGDRSRRQAGTVCQGGDSEVLDCRPDETDGVLVCRNPGGDRYGSMTRVEPSGILWMWTVCPGLRIPAVSAVPRRPGSGYLRVTSLYAGNR